MTGWTPACADNASASPGDRALTIVHLNTERGWRGGERQTLWLARELARLGHRSLVAARPHEPLAQRTREADLDVIECAPAGEADVLAALGFRRALRREQADLVHAHTAHAVGVAALATLGTSVPMVLTRRVDFPLRGNAASRWKYRRAAAIIAISRAVRAVLVESGIPEGRIDIVPSGIDLSRHVAPSPADVLGALGIPEDAPLAVMVGALVDHKDPATFVRAIASARRRVPSMRALLVGEGPLRPMVEALIAELELGDTLRLTGFRADAEALIAAAGVCVLSSEEEGLGTVLLDALAAGTPVAATSAGGIPEIIEPGRSGLLVAPHDHAGLGAAIASILSDPALRERLVAGGRERVLHFSVAETARRTLEVYRRVLRERQ